MDVITCPWLAWGIWRQIVQNQGHPRVPSLVWLKLNPVSKRGQRAYLFYTVNTAVADDLGTQGSMASAQWHWADLPGIFQSQHQQFACLFNNLFGLTAKEALNLHITSSFVTTTCHQWISLINGQRCSKSLHTIKTTSLNCYRELWFSRVYDRNHRGKDKIVDIAQTTFSKPSRICVFWLRWFNEQRYKITVC